MYFEALPNRKSWHAESCSMHLAGCESKLAMAGAAPLLQAGNVSVQVMCQAVDMFYNAIGSRSLRPSH